MKETINEDTYQTLKEVEVTPYEKASLPMWKRDTGQKEEKPETPKDYTLTKDEEKRYKSLLLNNRDEFEDLLPQEKGYFYGTSPIDYDQRILFDEAERIRVNAETSISKEEALRRAFRIYGEEKAPVVEGSGWGIKKRG